MEKYLNTDAILLDNSADHFQFAFLISNIISETIQFNVPFITLLLFLI